MNEKEKKRLTRAAEKAAMIQARNEVLESFFTETTHIFQFLEYTYGYQRLEGIIEYLDEPRDTEVEIRYVGPIVGIDITWATYNAVITVIFYELLQPSVLPTDEVSHREYLKKTKLISLYNLADMLGKRKDPDFLLKDSDNTRNLYKNGRIIQANQRGVLEGLARATQTYATPILLGDTSIFSQVIQYTTEKWKKQGFFIGE